MASWQLLAEDVPDAVVAGAGAFAIDLAGSKHCDHGA